MTTDDPIIFQWHGHYWNDIRFLIEVVTRYRDETIVDTLDYYKTGIIDPIDGYTLFKSAFKYEILLSLLNQEFPDNTNVVNRSFGQISVYFYCGDESFLHYKELYNREIESSFYINSDIQSVIGVTSSKSSQIFHDLWFDHLTLKYIVEDPKMAKFKFVTW